MSPVTSGELEVSRRKKLLQRMRISPHKIRFEEAEALLVYEGFVLVNSQGSHRTYRHPDGRAVFLVRPHGGRTTCHPDDVRDLLRILDLAR